MKNKLKSILNIVEQILPLQREAVRQTLAFYKPEVDLIVRMKIKDKARIEQALDQMLDVAFDENVLKLFKKLCRHYYFIDPRGAAFYVQSYREMYDEESLTLDSKCNSASITHHSRLSQREEVKHD